MAADLSPVAGRRIGLCVCGGIAAYKVPALARELNLAGADVRVVMTRSAAKFVGEITFSTLTGNDVLTDKFWDKAPAEIPHTTLARSCDLILVAPATANLLGTMAHGMAGDVVGSLLIAFTGPVVVAPAMHAEMWVNEATQDNVRTLRARGVVFAGPDDGPLAAGDSGPGRLAGAETILGVVARTLARRESLAGVRVLVTAGGTREPIDAVRFIGNRSSGKMGYALAAEAAARGGKVTLVTAPSGLVPEAAAEVIRVETAAEMADATLRAAADADVVLMAAAVSDWRPKSSSAQKLKKAAGLPLIELEETQDILAILGERKPSGQILVGFAAETTDVERATKEKLVLKNLDLAVGNLVGVEGSGFDAPTNLAYIAGREGYGDALPLMSKRELAAAVLDTLTERYL